MNFFQDIQNAIAAVENFGQHLPPEVQPDFTSAVTDLKGVATAAADAGVAVAGTETATIPVVGPLLAPMLVQFLDGLIAQAQAAKASVAAPKAA